MAPEALFIPFAIGNLDISEESRIRIQVVLKEDSVKTMITGNRVIMAGSAKSPLTIKTVGTDSFDSAYYKRAILAQPTSMQYFLNGNKVFLPSGFMSWMFAMEGNIFNLPQNTTIELGGSQTVHLLDY